MTECPHCHKPISLVTTKELIQEHGISQALITDWRKKEKFPQPWSLIGGRAVWLKEETDAYFQQWGEQKVERTADTLAKSIAHLGLSAADLQMLLDDVRTKVETKSV